MRVVAGCCNKKTDQMLHIFFFEKKKTIRKFSSKLKHCAAKDPETTIPQSLVLLLLRQ